MRPVFFLTALPDTTLKDGKGSGETGHLLTKDSQTLTVWDHSQLKGGNVGKSMLALLLVATRFFYVSSWGRGRTV